MAELILTIAWKWRPKWPKDVSTLTGYASIDDARKQLSKRWPHKTFVDVPNGFKYEEPFNCAGERGTRVFTITTS